MYLSRGGGDQCVLLNTVRRIYQEQKEIDHRHNEPTNDRDPETFADTGDQKVSSRSHSFDPVQGIAYDQEEKNKFAEINIKITFCLKYPREM